MIKSEDLEWLGPSMGYEPPPRISKEDLEWLGEYNSFVTDIQKDKPEQPKIVNSPIIQNTYIGLSCWQIFLKYFLYFIGFAAFAGTLFSVTIVKEYPWILFIGLILSISGFIFPNLDFLNYDKNGNFCGSYD